MFISFYTIAHFECAKVYHLQLQLTSLKKGGSGPPLFNLIYSYSFYSKITTSCVFNSVILHLQYAQFTRNLCNTIPLIQPTQ